MAMNMGMITRSWLVLRIANDSPFALAMVMVSFAIPVTFVSAIGGVLADKISRKRIIIIGAAGNGLTSVVLGLLDMTDVVAFWHIFVIGMVNGSMMALSMPSRTAILSDIIPKEKLMNAMALQSSAMNSSRIIGPAAAGFLIIFIDTWGVFFLIGGAYVLAVLASSMLGAGSEPVSNKSRGMGGDIKDGFSYSFKNPTLLALLVMGFIPILFGMAYQALLPAWAREALDVQSNDLGILMMIMGVGALAGTLLLASLKNFNQRGLLLIAACAFWGLILAFFAQTTDFVVAIPLLLMMGFVGSIFMSLNMTLLQVYSSPEMRGRVMSIAMMSFGLMPLSAVPFGILAEAIGTPDSLMISGILLLAFTVIFYIAYPAFRRIE